MDINMPVMDGYEAIRRIMSESPRPIIVLTSIESSKLLNVSFKALSLGALSVMTTPAMGADAEVETRNLITEVKTMAAVKVVRRPLWLQKSAAHNAILPTGKSTGMVARHGPIQLIAIGVSTGGPPALHTLLNGLPSNFGVPIVVVQHMAMWLSSTTPLNCRVAEQDEVLQAGTMYLAPDDKHMTIKRTGVIDLDSSAPLDGHRPAATALFESVAISYGPAAVGLLLTGMGEDGARGLLAMHRAGAHTIAQNEATSVVYGMPKAACEMGAAEEKLALNQIADRLLTLVAP
jgi:two-component system chemotaxis response regulator CheB